MMGYWIYALYRIFWYPFLRWILPLVNAKARQRLQFELGQRGECFQSFKTHNLVADCSFECSSEGEFEQLMPMLTSLLQQGKRVEVIYCSESVHHRCLNLALQYPQHLRIYPLPILSFFPWVREPSQWLTAAQLVMCRYDFFPELIFYGRRTNVKFTLVWATLKKSPAPMLERYYRWVYTSFDQLVAATEKDALLFNQRYQIDSQKILVHDFRPVQIARRLMNGESTLQNKFPHFSVFKQYLNTIPMHSRLIFGSFWTMELASFDHPQVHELLKQKFLIAIAPHNITQDNCQAIIEGLAARNITCYQIHSEISAQELEELCQKWQQNPGVWLISLKGVLCELYAHFAFSYVGGGHGVSIHSVLEPFVAGCQIFCGPKVHRSTEYDLIMQKAPHKIELVESLPQFFTSMARTLNLNYQKTPMELEQVMAQNQQSLHWLGLE